MISTTNKADTDGAAAPRAVAVARLTLTDFRNYTYLHISVAPGPVVLIGPNGAGKTNILEAISMFSPGRGLRRAPLGECAREGGAGGFAVASEVQCAAGSLRLGTGLVAESDVAAGHRQCRIDGKSVRGPGAFADHLRLAWITPAMDRLFSGPAGDRRRFLDRIVATMDGQHPSRIAAFDRAMTERNRLLASGRTDPAWLAGLEAQMAEWGTAVAAARLTAIAELQRAIEDAAEFSAFPPVRLDIEGVLERQLGQSAAVDVEDRFRSALGEARNIDRAAGRTLSGPHRSDLNAFHGHTGVAAQRCSTGEQKALIIAIVLAQARIIARTFAGGAPILLLDEIAAHLDASRRVGLFDAVAALGAQAWMTGTDRAPFEALFDAAQFLSVADGAVQEG